MNAEILESNFSWLYFYHGSVASLGAAYNHPYQPAKQELMSSTAQFNIHPATPYYRMSRKTHFQNAVGATVHRLNHKYQAPLVS